MTGKKADSRGRHSVYSHAPVYESEIRSLLLFDAARSEVVLV